MTWFAMIVNLLTEILNGGGGGGGGVTHPPSSDVPSWVQGLEPPEGHGCYCEIVTGE